jgi:hypothetical protein
MSLQIVKVEGDKLLERFVRLPMRLNAGDPSWVSPLLQERRDALSAKVNPFFQHAEVAMWLAVRDGRDVGRITAQIDSLAPADPRGPAGWFGMIAGEDEAEVFKTLLATAEAWLKERGCVWALGPFNLTTTEEVGLLVDGFGTPPMVMMGHDPRYAGTRIEEQGYTKAKDLFAWYYDITVDLPEKVKRRLGRSRRPGVVLRHLDFKRYDEDVRNLTEIYNDAWSGNWGFTPLTEAETHHLGKSLKPLIHPKLIWFVDVDGETAGFIVGLPNMNEAIKDLDGKLFPFGFAKLLWRLKYGKIKSGRVPLMGVKRKFAHDATGALLPFMLIDALRTEAVKMGYRDIELSWILEDNAPMNRINEALGGDKYKTYRIYERKIA